MIKETIIKQLNNVLFSKKKMLCKYSSCSFIEAISRAVQKKISCVCNSISYRTANCHCLCIRSVFMMQMRQLLMLRIRRGKVLGCKYDTRVQYSFLWTNHVPDCRITKPCKITIL